MTTRAGAPMRLLVLAACAAVTMACAPAAIGTLDRMDVTLQVQPNGSIDVEEVLTAGARTAPGAVVTRVITPPEADRLQLTATAIDGVVRAGPQDGVAVDQRGSRLRVRWHLPSGAPAPHVLTLRYRAFAAVRVDEPRGRIAWQAIAPRRGFDVANSRLVLALPPGVPFYEGTGVAEAGWTVARTPTGISATRSALPDGQGATVLGEFDIDPSRIAESEWQIDEDRQWNFLPSYATAAIFMVVTAGGALFILRRQYPKREPGDALTGDAQLDAERLAIGTGLRVTAAVGAVVAVACSVFCYLVLPNLGPWVHLVPASMLVVAAWFVIAARGWDRDVRA